MMYSLYVEDTIFTLTNHTKQFGTKFVVAQTTAKILHVCKSFLILSAAVIFFVTAVIFMSFQNVWPWYCPSSVCDKGNG